MSTYCSPSPLESPPIKLSTHTPAYLIFRLYIYIRIQTDTRARTHIHTYTHTYIYTHIQRHKHQHVCPLTIIWGLLKPPHLMNVYDFGSCGRGAVAQAPSTGRDALQRTPAQDVRHQRTQPDPTGRCLVADPVSAVVHGRRSSAILSTANESRLRRRRTK